MKIKFLGTTAAEGFPAMFCTCKSCTEARKRGGKNIRTRTQALIDEQLLIDFPADTFMHCILNNIDLSTLEHCLITHTHSDHFYAGDLCSLIPGYSKTPSRKPVFTFYGAHGAMLKVNSAVNGISLEAGEYIGTKALPLYTPTKVGDFTVTALEAIHDPSAFPVIYIVENSEKKALLYAHDTHYFCDGVWDYFEKSGVKLNFVSLDCTNANDPKMNYIGHMNLNDNVKVMNRLREIDTADENTIFCSNHFSHNGTDVLYEGFSAVAEKFGILTSYDGMEVEF